MNAIRKKYSKFRPFYNFTRSIAASDMACRYYNSKQTIRRHKLTNQERKTMEVVLWLFKKELQSDYWYYKGVDVDNMPSVRTNNGQLATLIGYCKKTAYNHLEKLRKANLICHKITHGSDHNYELFINPYLVLVEGSKALKMHQSAHRLHRKFGTENKALAELREQILLHSVSCFTSKINNKILVVNNYKNSGASSPAYVRSDQLSAEKRSSLPLTTSKKTSYTGNGSSIGDIPALQRLKSRSERALQKLATPTGNTGKSPKKSQFSKKEQHAEQTGGRRENFTKNQLGTGKSVHVSRFSEAPLPPAMGSLSARNTFLAQYTQMLWDYTKVTLYHDRVLLPSQQEKALKLIRKLYQTVPNEKLGYVHHVYRERIAMAAKYIARDPKNRYAQLPDRYFDTSNPHGFVGTRKWYHIYKERKARVKATSIVYQAIHAYIDAKKGVLRGMSKPLLQVYREAENWVKKLHSETRLQEFYAGILDYETKLPINNT